MNKGRIKLYDKRQYWDYEEKLHARKTKKGVLTQQRVKGSQLKILISNLDMSYKNLSARANCSISLL